MSPYEVGMLFYFWRDRVYFAILVTMQAIQFRQSLFWDTDPKKIDVDTNATYIIERIMDFGSDNEVRWMRKQYPRQLLFHVCETSKQLHKSSKTLWTMLTNQ